MSDPIFDLVIDCTAEEGGEPELREHDPAYLTQPPRRQLPKSTVTARLIAMGKASAVKAAFDADPNAFFRWVAPDWPNIFADDEGLLAFLAGLGLTAEQIAAVTA